MRHIAAIALPRTTWRPVAIGLFSLAAACFFPLDAAAQERAPAIPNPDGVDMFQLNDPESYRQFSSLLNFEIVGHSYFRGPWLAPGSPGGGFNTPRVCGQIGFFAGYNPTVFGVLIADVSDPAHMQPLSFIPGNPGTRNAYLRVDCDRQILAFGHSFSNQNPDQPPEGQPIRSGITFHDVSEPSNPVLLGEWNNAGRLTHGIDMDSRYVYACGTSAQSKPEAEELHIIDYADPREPRVVGRYHVMGQHQGEAYSPLNQLNPNGTEQRVTCHEIVKDGNRLYLAYRDAGVIILDISDPANPVEVGVFDYSPPFNGDPGIPPGCCPGAHTAAPVPHAGSELPHLLMLTDEHFSCPPGFAWILDISNPQTIQVLSTIHIRGVDDQYDFATGQFVCPEGQQSSHLPWFDPRGHGSLVYLTWYDQGLRAFDISDPFAPREVGYFISPDFSVPRQVGRHIRESYLDPVTNLIYVTDGNGGGVTVLRYTGPIPEHPPMPGAR
jgi:hypothetical protein